MWGVTAQDDPDMSITNHQSFLSRLIYSLKDEKTPQEKILLELSTVRSMMQKEILLLDNPSIEDDIKKKRLVYLFVKDLLTGVNGMILDHKDRQDNLVRSSVSFPVKVVAAIFILLVCLAMLFYLYLFSLRQTLTAQNAWFNSFVAWLIFDIILISTGVVLVEHVMIPMWSFRAVRTVKQKILRVRCHSLYSHSRHID